MRTVLFAAIAAMFTFATVNVQAMPAASLKGASKSDQTITQVRDGCGRGWYRGRHGHCRRL